MRRLNILTWHVHGNYLYYLGHCQHNFYLPVKTGRPEGYGGRCGTLPWPANIIELSADAVKRAQFDCILFQSKKNYETDQYEILSTEQRQLPRLYLEHDPPRQNPTDTKHLVDDPGMLLVHVTNFNQLMWDNNRTPTTVVEHGVIVPPDARYTGELERGISVVNGLSRRGRRLGLDVFENVRRKVPLDLVGMLSEEAGGCGEVPYAGLHFFTSRYRFFFNPIRYTSLGLSVCEAMMVGLPIIGLATTEMAAVVKNGVNGFVDTNLDTLIACMTELLKDIRLAEELSAGARSMAQRRFGIDRFVRDWMRIFDFVCGEEGTHRVPAQEGDNTR